MTKYAIHMHIMTRGSKIQESYSRCLHRQGTIVDACNFTIGAIVVGEENYGNGRGGQVRIPRSCTLYTKVTKVVCMFAQNCTCDSMYLDVPDSTFVSLICANTQGHNWLSTEYELITQPLCCQTQSWSGPMRALVT